MSILEKKAIAFEKLAALQNEAVIDEILAHLVKLNSEEKHGCIICPNIPALLAKDMLKH